MRPPRRTRTPGVVDSPLPAMDALRTAAVTDAPLLMWTFDEASGTTVADHSGFGRDATVSGTVARSAIPLIGSHPSTCMHAGRVAIADAAWMNITPDMTAECVVMLSRPPAVTAAIVFGRYDVGALCWHIAVDTSGATYAAVRNASGTYQSANSTTVPCPIGRPAHVVMTRTTSSITLFLNGTVAATGTSSGAMLTGSSSIWMNKAGTEAGSGAAWERGVLHVGFAACYSAALSPGRVLAHAQAGGFA